MFVLVALAEVPVDSCVVRAEYHMVHAVPGRHLTKYDPPDGDAWLECNGHRF